MGAITSLHHFSFPLSQTCVERTFNFLKKMARAERMAMKDKSITQEPARVPQAHEPAAREGDEQAAGALLS